MGPQVGAGGPVSPASGRVPDECASLMAVRAYCRMALSLKKGRFMRVRKAIILAAGYGTRFLPATKAIPKEMLPLVDRPAIQYVVEEAVRAGLEQIVMVTAANKRAVEDHFSRTEQVFSSNTSASSGVAASDTPALSASTAPATPDAASRSWPPRCGGWPRWPISSSCGRRSGGVSAMP